MKVNVPQFLMEIARCLGNWSSKTTSNKDEPKYFNKSVERTKIEKKSKFHSRRNKFNKDIDDPVVGESCKTSLSSQERK